MTSEEQVARLEFFARVAKFEGKTVLELGSGDGFNCHYIVTRLGGRKAVGLDISESMVLRARRNFPEAEFHVDDICRSDLFYGEFDYVLCCEVLEHLLDPVPLMCTMHRHLASEGIGLLSTPNRSVFSLGERVSPIHKEHVREYDFQELRALLSGFFPSIEIWGQKFKSTELLGKRQAMLARNIRDRRMLGKYYWHPWLRKAWKGLRCEPVIRWIEGSIPFSYSAQDFEMVDPDNKECLWFCASLKRNSRLSIKH